MSQTDSNQPERKGMKKTTKGALAAGAAALLLAGGAGTFAAWTSDGGDTPGAVVDTGRLAVEQVPETATWTWQTTGREGQLFNPATDTLVPGDEIRFTSQYLLDVEGTNLSAELVATSGATGSGTDGALPSGLSWTPDAGNTLTDLNEAEDDDTTVTVGGTLTFDGAETGSMDEAVTVDDLTVTVRQTAPAAA